MSRTRGTFRGRDRSPIALILCTVLISLISLLAPPAAGAQGDDEAPCGIPPAAKPKRIKGGEGVPPLPLPATPLRRTERKRDPAPPTLAGKIIWGRRDLVWKTEDGREKRFGDWSNDPNDLPRLFEVVARDLRVKYRSENVDLARFSFDPAKIPILYATGLKPFQPSEAEMTRLRDYLLAGGLLLGVAHHGAKEFNDSFRKAAAALFPDRPFALLPPDHPIYRAHRPLGKIDYSPLLVEPNRTEMDEPLPDWDHQGVRRHREPRGVGGRGQLGAVPGL